MVTGFYLVSKDSNKEQEAELFKKLNDDVDINLVSFEDIIPMAQNDFNGKIILKNGELDCPDFVYVRVFNLGDKAYHLKAVLDMFKYLGVLCINSAETKEKTADKLLTSQIVNSVTENIKIPKTLLVTPDLDAKSIIKHLNLPVVIKIMHGGAGKGIALIDSEKELDSLLNMIFAAPFNDQILAQEAILSSKGKDIRLIIANDEIIHSFVRVNPNDFKSNVSKGGHIEDFDAPEKLVKETLAIAKELDLKLGSIDYLFGENKGEFYFCEANSSIGLSYLYGAINDGNSEILKNYSNLLLKLF